MKKYDVLVTDSNYKHSLAAVRILGESGLKIAVCSEGFSATRFSKYCRGGFRYKKEDFKEKLILFLRKNKVKLVLPIGYSSNIQCSEISDLIKKFSNIVIDDYQKIVSVSKKADLYPLLKRYKISFPKTWIISKLEDIEKIDKKCSYFVIKSSIEEMGKKVEYVKEFYELRDKVSQRLKLYGPQIVQEFIFGEGRGFFAFCKDGQILQSFQHRRIRQYPETGGVSSCAESIFDEKLEKIGKEFLKRINWTGPVMLEFIYNPEKNKYYFIEMNAKFWGSLDLSIFCGLNFPIIPYKIVTNQEIIKRGYPVGKRFQWVLPEDTLRIKFSKNKKEAYLKWRKDLFSNNIGKDVNYLFKDPFPTLIRIIATFYGMIFKKCN